MTTTIYGITAAVLLTVSVAVVLLPSQFQLLAVIPAAYATGFAAAAWRHHRHPAHRPPGGRLWP